MKMKIGNLRSLQLLARNEEAAILERLEQVQIEMSELPYLIQRIELSKERDVLLQELRNAEIKQGNLLREIEFVKSKTVAQDVQKIRMMSTVSYFKPCNFAGFFLCDTISSLCPQISRSIPNTDQKPLMR